MCPAATRNVKCAWDARTVRIVGENFPSDVVAQMMAKIIPQILWKGKGNWERDLAKLQIGIKTSEHPSGSLADQSMQITQASNEENDNGYWKAVLIPFRL